MNALEQYIHDRDEQVKHNRADLNHQLSTERFTAELVRTNYTKNFTWMGIPILQYPTDLMVMQELIWKIKPEIIIETGVAFGGMLVFYASILDSIQEGGKVLGIDVDVREHTVDAVLRHPLEDRILIYQGDSVSDITLYYVKETIGSRKNVLVSLDSNHTHDHVLQELRLYAPLVSVGSYIVVFDTAIEFFGHLDKNQDRPWGKGNNPWTAVQSFMKENDDFVVDKEITQRALITAAPGGWIRRVK